MKDQQTRKLRSDRPSARQAAEQPEHSSLHQGQGPDFATQDSHLHDQNPGMVSEQRRPVDRKHPATRAFTPPETIEKKEDE
jgi:hypothetical protein